MDQLGNRLRHYRERAGYSIYDVEKRVGRHFSTISKYERGERQPNLSTLRELAATYEVPLGQLIGDSTDWDDTVPKEIRQAAQLFECRPDLFSLIELLQHFTPLQITQLKRFLSSLR